jgi:uncharacterized protein YbcI
MDIPTQPPLALERADANGLLVGHVTLLGGHRRVSCVSLYPPSDISTKLLLPSRTSFSHAASGYDGGVSDETAAPFPPELDSEPGGSLVAAISRDIVQVHSQFYGRGPTKAKTVWRDEIVVCVLEEIFTKAEQLLVDHGRFEEVRSHRTAFQDEVEPIFRAAVEAITGRKVKSFLSQTSRDGAASEVFVLGPAIMARAAAS